MATKEDIARLVKSIIRLRDDRIAQAEAQLTRLADDYRKLRQELLPVFKMAKERSEPLPYAPFQNPTISPDTFQPDHSSPPVTAEKNSLTRTFSKKLGLSSTPKNNSPTHIPNTIHEGRTLTDSSSLDPSAAATSASNQLTAGMSGGMLPQHSPIVPSPTSPLPYQPLAPRSYQREPNTALPRFSTDEGHSRSTQAQTPSHEQPTSAKSAGSGRGASTLSTASTIAPPRDQTASAPPPSSAGVGQDAPSVEIFKSFRVGLDDPCYKVLPAALRKYNIQADWRQYALYIVYGDQERCVRLEEKPLALFKDLDREGKHPMFMLRKVPTGPADTTTSNQGIRPLGVGASGSGGISSAASIRTMATGANLPGGVL